VTAHEFPYFKMHRSFALLRMTILTEGLVPIPERVRNPFVTLLVHNFCCTLILLKYLACNLYSGGSSWVQPALRSLYRCKWLPICYRGAGGH
jgi:hypothetical protein